MKFVHFADTHLGKYSVKSPEREQDFYDAFRQVIDFALERKVDFVIHSGDLFDTARPPVKTLVFVVSQLKRLREANIPFFVILGSHDMGVSDSIISVLDESGLLVNLNSSRYLKKIGDKVYLDGEHVGDCYICGIPGKRRGIEKYLKSVIIEPKGEFNIFMFHHTISDLGERFSDFPTSLLPKGFDYYAAGHWHGYKELKYDKGVIVYPSSTEFTDLKEVESGIPRGFMYVETSPFSHERILLNTRKFVILDVNCSGLKASEVAEKVMSEIKENGEKAVLVVKLFGTLKEGTKSEINRELIKENAAAKGYLKAMIYMNALSSKAESYSPGSEGKSIEEIEVEFLNSLGYSEKDIEIAQELMHIFGKKMTDKEIESILPKVKEEIEEMYFDNKKG